MLLKHSREHGKKPLYKVKEKNRNESRNKKPKPGRLNNQQTLVTNKAATYANKLTHK